MRFGKHYWGAALLIVAGLFSQTAAAGSSHQVEIDWKAAQALPADQFALPVAVDWSSATDGEWSVQGGVATWTLDVLVPGAKTASFLADRIQMPAGSRLMIVGVDGTAKTMDANWIVNGKLWSELVEGERFTLRATMPANAATAFTLHISEVQGGRFLPYAKTQSTELNYACVQDAVNIYTARATGAIVISNSTLCTGTLLNSAAGDYKKYFITASHCAGQTNLASNDYASKAAGFKVYFNEQTPCGQTLAYAHSTAPVVGATHRVRKGDVWLVELTGALPSGVYFSGFDASGVAAPSIYNVNHGSGKARQWMTGENGRNGQGYPLVFGGETLPGVEGGDYATGGTAPGASGSGIVFNRALIGVLYGGGGNGYDYSTLPEVWSSFTPYLGATTLAGAEPPPPPTVTLSGSPDTVEAGANTTISWSTTAAASCTASGDWSGAKATSGSESVTLANNDYDNSRTASFTLSCTGAGGSGSGNTTVTVKARPRPPELTFSASPTSITRSTGTSTLTWTSQYATSCTASGVSDWSGTKAASGSQSVGPYNTDGARSFSMTCTGAGGDVTKTASVTVTPPQPPTVSVGLSKSSIQTGSETATVSWTSTNATGCTASGDWSGAKGTAGSESVGPFAAATSKTYKLDCTGPGGTVSGSKTLTVAAAPAPTVSLSRSTGSITTEQTVKLTWSSTSANSCTASGDWSGSKATSGNETVGPFSGTGNKTFSLQCSGDGGNDSKSVSVVVTAVPAAAVTVSLNPSQVTIGQTAQVSWTSTNATGCTASGNWTGTKATSGFATVGPYTTTGGRTFTLTCNGAGGSGSASAALGVGLPAASLSLNASATSIQTGQTAKLTWTGSRLTSCTAGGSWTGSKATSGNETVGPFTAAGSKTYSLTCKTEDNTSLTESVAIAVTAKPADAAVTLSVSPTEITTGKTATLAWSSTNATACTASGDWSGSQSTSGTKTVGPYSAAGSKSFKLTCSGSGASGTANATLGVVAVPAPTVTLSGSRSTISVGETVALSWSSTDATSCAASGDWSGSKAIGGGNENVGPYTAAGNKSYTLSCTGAGGTSSKSVAVKVQSGNVPPAAPSLSMTLSTSEIAAGKTASLSWSSTDADACTASGAWSGSKATSGSTTVGPFSASGPKTFTLACTGPGGSVEQSRSLQITGGQVAVSLTSSATTITLGDSTVLTWNAGTASNCTASAMPSQTDWNTAVGNQGSGSVTPAAVGTVTYVLSCTDNGAPVQGQVTVTVNDVPVAPGEGGGGGGGSLSMPLLAGLGLMAALRRRRIH